ncbi:carbonic anhydrase [Nocardia sp. NBC_00565]|uniref:carbonic anhydrase n=1 Tax=Nocardia sp. NBC_00565 TaxID=2975993 RepID=UPI002E81C2D8|nr:carbonic anhydrase [Nocardia sp. NBC_00565]WUC06474.1 carbonic anhydrase [Nocardia sp. NBC_00565]
MGVPDRRTVLVGALTATTAVLAGCGGDQPSKQVHTAQAPPQTSKAAFDRLMAGNQRWIDGNLDHPDRDPERRELLAQNQQPYGVVLSCIDSRVPPELVFDTGLGDLFVMRTGGLAVGPVVIGSVEYGPMTSATPLIMVLGHQRCGAVAAAYKALQESTPLPGNLQSIVEALRPAYERMDSPGDDPVETMTRIQIELTAQDLRRNNDLAPVVERGALSVVGAYYNLDTGRVEVLDGAPA